jgi:hypothetical protein
LADPHGLVKILTMRHHRAARKWGDSAPSKTPEIVSQ